MLGSTAMSKGEARLRENHLRREKFKKIKAGNGEAYKNHLEANRERSARRRKRLKEGTISYQEELERGRKNWGRYKSRLEKNSKLHYQFKNRRAGEGRRRGKFRRRTLHETYIGKLLFEGGLPKDEITKALIEFKKLHIKIRRLVSKNNKIPAEILEAVTNKTRTTNGKSGNIGKQMAF